MANIVLSNFGDSTLNTGISASDVSMTVATGGGALFPAISGGNWFYAVLEDVSANKEIVKVTARTSDTMTIVRAQEGTTARVFASGSLVSLRLTVQAFQDYVGSVALTTSGAATLTNKSLQDSTTFIVDDADATKKVQLQVSPVTTGTTRTLTVQDKDLTIAGTNVAQDFTAPQRATPLTDNDLSFDLSAKQNFTCTWTGAGTLTFTGMASAAGQSGWIKFVQSGSGTVAKAATTQITAANLTRLGAAGTYIASYYCDGTDVYVSIGTYA